MSKLAGCRGAFGMHRERAGPLAAVGLQESRITGEHGDGGKLAGASKVEGAHKWHLPVPALAR